MIKNQRCGGLFFVYKKGPLNNGEDFWIIDMALAKDSALLSCVPKDKIKAVEEDWIPRISIKEL